MTDRRVVITGLGIISAAGSGQEELWHAALSGRSHISSLEGTSLSGLPIRFAGLIKNFQPQKYSLPRKSLKVMSRDISLAVAASILAAQDAALKKEECTPERCGVSIGAGLFNNELEELESCLKKSMTSRGDFDLRAFGCEGMKELYPLWLLKYLPNMPACHISILHNLQGPSNTVTTDASSGSVAVGEAFRIIQRGDADLMFCGGADSKTNPLGFLKYATQGLLSLSNQDGYRPFDERSKGLILGEAGAVIILEEWEHARKRNAKIYAEVASFSFLSNLDNFKQKKADQEGRTRVIQQALDEASLSLNQLELIYLNASGVPEEDRWEAQTLKELFKHSAKRPYVTATKALTGFTGFAAAVVELCLASLSLFHQKAPPAVSVERPILNEGFLWVKDSSSLKRFSTCLINSITPEVVNAVLVLKKAPS